MALGLRRCHRASFFTVRIRQGACKGSALLDVWWRKALSALACHVAEDARVLLPIGDWPRLDCAAQFYRITDTLVAVDGFDAILIHKGMLTSFRQADIGLCLREMVAVYANPVFVLFVQQPRRRHLFLPAHVRILKIYADPARYHSRHARRGAFMHIPKTGGTSIWSCLSRSVRSTVYFASDATLAAFDGDLDAFELVGGHIHAETLVARNWQSPTFFVLRDPVRRVLSAIAHARRTDGNLATFDESFHVMRQIDGTAPDENLRKIIFYEGNLQIRMLAERPGDDLHDPATREAMYRRACARLEQSGWQYGCLEDPVVLARRISDRFGVRTAKLPHLNRTAQRGLPDYARQIEELVLDEDNCMDIKLYRKALALQR